MVGHLADLIEGVVQGLKFPRELRVNRRYAAARHGALHGIRQRAVRVSAHRDVIVDVDQFAREAAREKSRDEQGDVSEALQAPLPRSGCRRLERIRQHLRERPDAQALRRALVQRVGAGEHGEQVDHVLLGLLVDIEMLMLARGVKRVTKEFAQGTDRYERSGYSLHAWHPFLPDTILSAKLHASEGEEREPVSENAYFYRYLRSAVDAVGC